MDDRALNGHVWRTLVKHVAQHKGPLRILEVGGGIGTMLIRILSRGLFTQNASYYLVDSSPQNIAYAESYLTQALSEVGWQVEAGEILRLQRNGQTIDVFLRAQALDTFHKNQDSKFDLIIANAFLDLLPLTEAVSQLLAMSTPVGLFYFTINFDGLTLFEPIINPQLDAQIQSAYHRTMEQRRYQGRATGGSHAGRTLYSVLTELGASVLAAGSSDWAVHPANGRYPEDEAYFLHFIIQTVHNALHDLNTIDSDMLSQWTQQRHAQIEEGRLFYVAHQLDYIGQASVAL